MAVEGGFLAAFGDLPDADDAAAIGADESLPVWQEAEDGLVVALNDHPDARVVDPVDEDAGGSGHGDRAAIVREGDAFHATLVAAVDDSHSFPRRNGPNDHPAAIVADCQPRRRWKDRPSPAAGAIREIEPGHGTQRWDRRIANHDRAALKLDAQGGRVLTEPQDHEAMVTRGLRVFAAGAKVIPEQAGLAHGHAVGVGINGDRGNWRTGPDRG